MQTAIDLLGWREGTAADIDLLGANLIVVAKPVSDEIARRRSERLLPITDPWLLNCHFALDPAFLSRPSPVQLLGALAVRQGWRTARGAAGTFAAFGPRAVVLPPPACKPAVLTEAAVTGIGVISWDGSVASLLASPGRPAAGQRTHIHRLAEEIVWDALARKGLDQLVPEHAQVR